jgi:biopolymer transport protein ExbD/biopolymer transport protein TolR
MAFITDQGKVNTSLSEINVVPLVDVVLVLLIIFMVTAPILQTGIEVQLPETKTTNNVNPNQSVVISITKDGLLYFRSETININALVDRLKQEVTNPKEPIYVRADGDVKFNVIVTVFDTIRESGFTQIQLVTKPLKEKS